MSQDSTSKDPGPKSLKKVSWLSISILIYSIYVAFCFQEIYHSVTP